MPNPGDLKDVLAQLRERYLATSDNTVTAFRQLAEQLERTPDATGVIDALRRELHRLRGTAGSYGFHETSRLAAALEPVVHKWAADRELDRPRRAAIVRGFVQALQESLHAAPTATATQAPEGAATSSPDETMVPPAPVARETRARLLLVDVPESSAARLASEAIHRGYRVEQVSADALAALTERRSDAIVVAGPRASVSVPEHTPVVVLRDGDGPVARPTANVMVVDATLDPRDLLRTIESRGQQSALTGVTALVVEDDPAMSDLLRALAEQHGMFVEVATDAEHLSDKLAACTPDVVLLDINLPGTSGVEATRAVRADARWRDIPIVLVSGATDVATRSAAFAAGADDFQSKPVAPEELLRRIERVLETRRQRQLALGVHPVTGLFLPARAAQTIDAGLAALAAAADPAVLAVVRPERALEGVMDSAAWQRELRRVASALTADGVKAGFADEVGVMLLFASTAEVVRDRLLALAADAAGAVSWSAGVAELLPGAEPSSAQLLRLADEALRLGREQGDRAHIWNPVDSGVAPDVIVVEDDDALADLITFALSARGLTWARFADGPAALKGLTAMRVLGRVPIVLLDVDLPGLDGFSLFERLRIERPGAFRVVFVTVHSSEADQLRAIRAGALDYLPKPVSLRVLMAKIGSWRSGMIAG